jgi:hypothetical protein
MEPMHPSTIRDGTDIDHLRWSPLEKKIARNIYDGALTRELDAIIQRTKTMAVAITAPSDLWDLEEYITRSRRAIDDKYDYRYSQLPLLFGRLFREGRITQDDLSGLGEDKLRYVYLVAEIRASAATKMERNL